MGKNQYFIWILHLRCCIFDQHKICGMSKSFYDPDYIIELGEKRVEQYVSACRAKTNRILVIVLIYLAFFVHIGHIIRGMKVGLSPFDLVVAIICGLLLLASFGFATLLVLPGEADILSLRLDFSVDDKYSYIDALCLAQKRGAIALSKKYTHYRGSLLFAIVAAIPYLVLCFRFPPLYL
jgi:hypothetical protein